MMKGRFERLERRLERLNAAGDSWLDLRPADREKVKEVLASYVRAFLEKFEAKEREGRLTQEERIIADYLMELSGERGGGLAGSGGGSRGRQPRKGETLP